MGCHYNKKIWKEQCGQDRNDMMWYHNTRKYGIPKDGMSLQQDDTERMAPCTD